MAVANTYTMERLWGSRIVVKDMGFLLNNNMFGFNLFPGVTDTNGLVGTPPNLIAPGKRPVSSQTPTIVAKDGRVKLITGSPGTWSQTLMDHYHLHCIVTGGGLSAEGTKWVSSSTRYLFAVGALSKVFRGKFCAGLERLYRGGQLQFHGKLAAMGSPGAYQQLLLQAVSQKLVQ
jgi:hypothetical protein